jgi:hypothetical protein
MLPVLSKLNNANGPRLTRTRIILALAIAVFTDGLQFMLGPLGWAFIDDVIDVIAMILTSWVLGFHWLLLPTFVLKLIPLANDLPTWTACVAAVIFLRKREQRKVPQAAAEKPPIEI